MQRQQLSGFWDSTVSVAFVCHPASKATGTIVEVCAVLCGDGKKMARLSRFVFENIAKERSENNLHRNEHSTAQCGPEHSYDEPNLDGPSHFWPLPLISSL